jgi:hypothetical protein
VTENGKAEDLDSLKGKPYFADNFDEGCENWQVEKWEDDEKAVQVAERDGRLHVKTESRENGVMIWCKKELPKDFIFEYDFTPLSPSGFFLIFFCYRGQDGKDILGPPHWTDRRERTLFRKYTRGVLDGYHISYRRNESATCNFRKNSGMELLLQQKLDVLLPANETHHVRLVKKGGRVRLTVNGRTFADVVDDGSRGGPVREGGRIGLRQVYESEGLYDNVRIVEL